MISPAFTSRHRFGSCSHSSRTVRPFATGAGWMGKAGNLRECCCERLSLLFALASPMRADSTSLVIDFTPSETGEFETAVPKLVNDDASGDWSVGFEKLLRRVSTQWGLTERQRDVLDLVARGKTNKEAATVLGISERTVEIHVHHITHRAGLQGRCELLAALLRAALESRFSTPR